jgi:hypothetical protein
VANVPISNITATWDDAAQTFYGFRLTVTDTLYNSSSKIFDLLTTGGSKFSVDVAGNVNIAGNITTAAQDVHLSNNTTSSVYIHSGSQGAGANLYLAGAGTLATVSLSVGYTGAILRSPNSLSWTSGTAINTSSDTGLSRYSAGVVKITDGSTGFGSLYAAGIGVGTTTPGELVDVVGNVQAVEFIGSLRGAVLFKAKAGEALTKGDVVYISGISGNITVVSKADANDGSKMPAFGLVKETASSQSACEVYTFGTFQGLDTSSYTEGTELFVSTTAGGLTDTPPSGESSLIQKIAKVTRSHASAGSIKVIGAGRTNATPNLNNGNIFIGNASNQASTASLSSYLAPYAPIASPTFTGTVTVSGDLNVTGTTTTINTTNLDVQDAVITLNKGQVTPANDIGLLFQRYSTPTASNYNVAIAWDESSDKFIFGKTPETGSDNDLTFNTELMTLSASGALIIPSSLQAGQISLSGARYITTNTGNTTMMWRSYGYTTGGNTGHIIGDTANTTYTNSSGDTVNLEVQNTVNQTGTAGHTDFLINRTETAAGSGGQYLIDAQVGGTSKFTVANTGDTVVDGALTFASDGAGGNWLKFYRQQTNYWRLTTSGIGDVFTVVGNSITFPQNVTIQRGGLLVQPTLTSTAEPFKGLITFNDVTKTYSAFKLDVTDTASAAGSSLIDAQVGGTSKFTVANTGDTTINATGTALTADTSSGFLAQFARNGSTVITLGGGSSSGQFWLEGSVGGNLSFGRENVTADFVMTNSTYIGGGTELFRVTSGGNVGIGTNAPTAKLHVAGTADQSIIVQSTDNNGKAGVNFKGAGDRGSIYGTASYDIHIEPNAQYGQADVIINSANGTTMNVGIGTSAPAAKLHIADTFNDVSTVHTAFKLDVTDTASAAGSSLMDLHSGGTSKASIGIDGTGYFGGPYNGGGIVRIGYNTNPPGGAARMGLWAIGAGKMWLAGYSTLYLGYQGKNVFDVGGGSTGLGFASVSKGTPDIGINRDSAGVLKVTDGSTGLGSLKASSILLSTDASLTSETATLATVSATQVASFPTTHLGAKLVIQAADTVSGERQISELTIIHDGTTVSVAEYGIVHTGSAALASYTAAIVSTNVIVSATGASTNSTTYKVVETLI